MPIMLATVTAAPPAQTALAATTDIWYRPEVQQPDQSGRTTLDGTAPP